MTASTKKYEGEFKQRLEHTSSKCINISPGKCDKIVASEESDFQGELLFFISQHGTQKNRSLGKRTLCEYRGTRSRTLMITPVLESFVLCAALGGGIRTSQGFAGRSLSTVCPLTRRSKIAFAVYQASELIDRSLQLQKFPLCPPDAV